MSSAPANALEWEGRTVLDPDGEKIGTIEEIFLVEETGRPEWALIKLGRLKGGATLVPLATARSVDDGIAVDVRKDLVGDAPHVDNEGELSGEEVDALYRHYGLNGASSSNGNGNGAHPPTAVMATVDAPGETPPGVRDAPIKELVEQAREQGSTLVNQELALAKAEMTGKAKQVGIGAGLFGAAGYVAHVAGLALMLCLVFALATAMEAWLAALVVAVLYAAIAGVLALVGRNRIKQAGPPIPEQTVESVKQTIATVKEEAAWGLGQTR